MSDSPADPMAVLRSELERERALRVQAERAAADSLADLERRYADTMGITTRLQLANRIAAAVDDAGTPEQALESALKAIVTGSGWSAGHAYRAVPGDEDGLYPADVWHALRPPAVEPLRMATQESTQEPGDPLIGRVLESGGPAWIADLRTVPSFRRLRAARQSGLASAAAIPVTHEGRLFAVLELFGPEPRPFEPGLVETLEFAARHLGRALEVLEAEDALRNRDAELAQLGVELQHLARIASHDLQEPLRNVTSYVELFMRRFSDKLDEPDRQRADMASAAALRMKGLLGDFLTYSSLWGPRQRHADVSLDTIFFQVAESLRARIDRARARLLAGPLPAVHGDPGLLFLLFEHLIDNALRHRGSEAPEIEIAAERRGTRWDISVTDNGPGMPAAKRESMFWLSLERERRPGAGLGLGLAICRRIVEHHEGRIRVDAAPSGGARFVFTLPSSIDTMRTSRTDE